MSRIVKKEGFMAKQEIQNTESRTQNPEQSKLKKAIEELGKAEQAYDKNKCPETLEAKRIAQKAVKDIKLGKI